MASSLPERRRPEQRGQRHTGSEDDPFLPRRAANFRLLFLFADASRIYPYRDSRFIRGFDAVFTTDGIRILVSPPKRPRRTRSAKE